MNEIKKIRDKLKINQNQLAKALGVSFSTVSRWETGVSEPNDSQIEQIEALQGLIENNEIDTDKLRKTILAIGLTGAIFAAVAVGVKLSGSLGGIFMGFLSKNSGGEIGKPIKTKNLSKILKKNGK